MDERGYVLAFYVATKHMVSYSAMMGKFAYMSKKVLYQTFW